MRRACTRSATVFGQHPLGNGLAAWWAFIVVPILLVTIVEEAGGEE